MTEKRAIQKLYIILRDSKGHIHHYSSAKASMHLDIILQYDIDLDTVTILEKGFILNDHRITANYDIRGLKRKNNDNK